MALATTNPERTAVVRYLDRMDDLQASGELEIETVISDVDQVVAEVGKDHSQLLDLVEVRSE